MAVKKRAKVARKAATKTAARKTGAKKAARKAAPKRGAKKTASTGAKKLLSGGNPQIAKGYGDDVVQSYINAMPGWKRNIGVQLDAIIERVVPGVEKAVKWNSPFYGVSEDSWFCSYHCFTKFVKVTFFRGTSLKPVPPGESKHPEVRYLDLYEVGLDEVQFAKWVKQASKLPGEKM